LEAFEAHGALALQSARTKAPAGLFTNRTILTLRVYTLEVLELTAANQPDVARARLPFHIGFLTWRRGQFLCRHFFPSKRFAIFTDRAERIESPAIRYRRCGVPCLRGNEKHITCFSEHGVCHSQTGSLPFTDSATFEPSDFARIVEHSLEGLTLNSVSE
jgi:hypothetical protein